MKPSYDEIVRWMKDYFATYNLYAQDAATVHRMDQYFVPAVCFAAPTSMTTAAIAAQMFSVPAR